MPAPLSSLPVHIVPRSFGGSPMYLDDASRQALSLELVGDFSNDNLRVARLGVGVDPTHRLHMISGGAAEKDVYIGHSIDNGTGLSSVYRPVDVDLFYHATDLAVGDLIWSGIRSGVNFGHQANASLGKAHSFTADMVISGAGHADNEYAPLYAGMRFDIGTGFTQTAVPTGRGWLMDLNVHGPIAARPDMLNGITLFFNNYFNGSPADSPAGGIWLVTRKGAGGGRTATHEAANTYPIDVGIGIVGDSNAGASAMGWTKGIQIGGFGSGWKESGSSYIGTGIDILDHFNYGIRVRTRLAGGSAVAIGVDSDAGPVVIGGTATISAASKLEVHGSSGADADPLVQVGQSSGSRNYTIKLRNGIGTYSWGIVGTVNAFLTGTIAGDSVLYTTTSGKALHIGGSTKVVSVTQDNKLGFFAVTPAVQQTGGVATAAGTYGANEQTMLQKVYNALRTFGLLS